MPDSIRFCLSGIRGGSLARRLLGVFSNRYRSRVRQIFQLRRCPGVVETFSGERTAGMVTLPRDVTKVQLPYLYLRYLDKGCHRARGWRTGRSRRPVGRRVLTRPGR